MRKHEILHPPQLYISDVQAILEDDQTIYVKQLQGSLDEQITFDIIESKGIYIDKFINQKCECLVEITDVEFSAPPPLDSEEDIDPTLLELKYMGFQPSTHFFPIPEEAIVEGKIDRQLHRSLAEEQFAEYGNNGFGLIPFDNQPILKSADGYSFLINKFIYKDLLKTTRKGTWLMAKIKEVELLSIIKSSEKEGAILPMDRVKEQQEEAEAMKTPKRKRFGVF